MTGNLWPKLLDLAAGGAAAPPDGAASLWQLYAPIARGGSSGRLVLGQLGQSLDGRSATAAGYSHYVNGEAAIIHLHRLRALVDAVVVGIGTVLADNPRLTVRRVEGRSPARVVIDPNGRLPAGANVLAEDGCRVIVITGNQRAYPGRGEAITLRTEQGLIDCRAIVDALAERGFSRLLIEGGGRTLSNFLAADAIDRLHLAIAPILIGSGPHAITLPVIADLAEARRAALAVYALGEDLLLDCRLKPGA